MVSKQVFPSGDIHYYNDKWNLIKAELSWGVVIDYTTKPKRVFIKN